MTLPPDLDIARSVTPKPVRDTAADNSPCQNGDHRFCTKLYPAANPGQQIVPVIAAALGCGDARGKYRTRRAQDNDLDTVVLA